MIILFYLLLGLVTLLIIGLIIFTPLLMEYIPFLKYSKKGEEVNIFYAVVIHSIIIVLLVTPLIKMYANIQRDYATEYLNNIRNRQAEIPIIYKKLLEDRSPDLGKAYQYVLSERLIIDEFNKKITIIKRPLKNHQFFIDKILSHLKMVDDQLYSLKGLLETSAVTFNQTSKFDDSLYTNVKAYIEQIEHNKGYINYLLTSNVKNAKNFLTQPNNYLPFRNRYPITKQNYQYIISFLLHEYPKLVNSLDKITTRLNKIDKKIRKLEQMLLITSKKQKKVIETSINTWLQFDDYSRQQFFKILYALETEYVVKQMGMLDTAPSLKALKKAIPSMIKYYSTDIERRWDKIEQDTDFSKLSKY